MTNREKAYDLYLNEEQTTQEDRQFADAFVRGADWKDQQFREYLQKKNEEYLQKLKHSRCGIEYVHYNQCICEIIQEFFKDRQYFPGRRTDESIAARGLSSEASYNFGCLDTIAKCPGREEIDAKIEELVSFCFEKGSSGHWAATHQMEELVGWVIGKIIK